VEVQPTVLDGVEPWPLTPGETVPGSVPLIKKLDGPQSLCGRSKGKANPVTDRGGPFGCETSRFTHFLDCRLTDGGDVVSLTLRPPFIPRKIPGTHFC
jgi:hypothetical protein